MAGDWIPWVKGLRKRPEVVRMSSILSLPRDTVVCTVMEVWEWCDTEGHFDEMSRDCHVFGVTLPFLVTLTCVPKFDEAMQRVGWVSADEEDGHPVFPKLGRWVGKSAKERLLAAERKRRQRKENVTNVTEMSRKDRDKNVTRVEKSRDIQEPPIVPQGTESEKPKRTRKRKVIPYPPEFNDWWQQYPKHRRDGKDDALAAYMEAIEAIVIRHPEFNRDQARAYLRQKTIEFASSPAGHNGKFTKTPGPWLRAGCYESDPAAWKTSGCPEEDDAPLLKGTTPTNYL